MSSARSSMHRVMWRQVRVNTMVIMGLVVVIIAVGIKSYSASGGAEGMKSLDALARNPAISALYGRVDSLNSAGAFVAWKMGMWIALACALWAGLTATRLLRASEDEGTWDFLAVSEPGREPAFVAAVAVLAECSILIGVVVFASLAVGAQSLASSLLYGLAMAGVTWSGAMLGALGSQLFAPRRSSSQLSLGAVGVLFLIRMLADGASANGWLRWFTPFGWLENVNAFGRRSPVWLAPLLVAPLVALGVAWFEQRRRDVGLAIWTRTDRSTAKTRLLSTPWLFAWRERRSTMVAWALGLGFFGLVVGYLTDALVQFSTSNPSYVKILEKWGLSSAITTGGFIGEFCVILALAISFLVVTLLVMIGTDMRQGRLDIPFASGTSRSTWLASGLVSTLVGVVLVAFVCAVAMWAGAEASGTSVPFATPLAGMMGSISAVPLLVGLTAFLVALWPRWAYVIMSAVLTLWYLIALLGPALQWPTRLIQLSPFHYLRVVPVQSVDWRAVLVFVLIGLVTGALGFATFARIDVG